MFDLPNGLESCRCLVIRDLRLDFLIGILEEEKRSPQPVVINLRAFVPESGPATSFDIADYVSYSDIIDGITALALSARHIPLVENLAEEVATIVLRDQRVKRVIVEIMKPEIIAQAAGVGVVIERTRQQ